MRECPIAPACSILFRQGRENCASASCRSASEHRKWRAPILGLGLGIAKAFVLPVHAAGTRASGHNAQSAHSCVLEVELS